MNEPYDGPYGNRKSYYDPELLEVINRVRQQQYDNQAELMQLIDHLMDLIEGHRLVIRYQSPSTQPRWICLNYNVCSRLRDFFLTVEGESSAADYLEDVFVDPSVEIELFELPSPVSL